MNGFSMVGHWEKSMTSLLDLPREQGWAHPGNCMEVAGQHGLTAAGSSKKFRQVEKEYRKRKYSHDFRVRGNSTKAKEWV